MLLPVWIPHSYDQIRGIAPENNRKYTIFFL
jgi:hypothetical protein